MAPRRYFVRGREVSRREALNEWLRQVATEGMTASYARRTFETAEELSPRRPGEIAQARGELDGKGIVVTGAEGL
jgi:hypothetical protein